MNNFVTNGEMFCFINHFMWHLFQHLLEERSLIVILPGLFNQFGYMSFWMMMISTAHRKSNISKKNQIHIFSRWKLWWIFYWRCCPSSCPKQLVHTWTNIIMWKERIHWNMLRGDGENCSGLWVETAAEKVKRYLAPQQDQVVTGLQLSLRTSPLTEKNVLCHNKRGCLLWSPTMWRGWQWIQCIMKQVRPNRQYANCTAKCAQ